MTALSVRSAQRRYVLLTALRWLPVGFVIPVTVLLAASRGLSPVEIGLAFTAHGVVVVALELPTGGLADALGRRPVLLLSGALDLVGLLALAVAHDAWAFALAYAVIGAGRALNSGSLEAWFVDAVHAADLRADTTPGLARGAVADSPPSPPARSPVVGCRCCSARRWSPRSSPPPASPRSRSSPSRCSSCRWDRPVRPGDRCGRCGREWPTSRASSRRRSASPRVSGPCACCCFSRSAPGRCWSASSCWRPCAWPSSSAARRRAARPTASW